MPTITERFPPVPLEELLPAIEKFQASPLEEKHALLARLVGVHPIFIRLFKNGHRFQRARFLGDAPIPNHVDEVIWLKDRPAPQNRLNPEGFSVLYVADHIETALMETNITAGQVAISEFEILNEKTVKIAPIGDLNRIARTGRGLLPRDNQNELCSFLNACKENELKSLLITDAFLYDCIVKDDKPYSISSFIGKCIFEKLPEISAIAYPSQAQEEAFNLAIRVDNFWEGWGVRAVKTCHAKHLANGYFEVSNVCHVIGITFTGDFHWGDEVENINSTSLLNPIWTEV